MTIEVNTDKIDPPHLYRIPLAAGSNEEGRYEHASGLHGFTSERESRKGYQAKA